MKRFNLRRNDNFIALDYHLWVVGQLNKKSFAICSTPGDSYLIASTLISTILLQNVFVGNGFLHKLCDITVGHQHYMYSIGTISRTLRKFVRP